MSIFVLSAKVQLEGEIQNVGLCREITDTIYPNVFNLPEIHWNNSIYRKWFSNSINFIGGFRSDSFSKSQSANPPSFHIFNSRCFLALLSIYTPIVTWQQVIVCNYGGWVGTWLSARKVNKVYLDRDILLTVFHQLCIVLFVLRHTATNMGKTIRYLLICKYLKQ